MSARMQATCLRGSCERRASLLRGKHPHHHARKGRAGHSSIVDRPRLRLRATDTDSERPLSDWVTEDEWGRKPTLEDTLDDYLDGDSSMSYGFELIGGALALAALASFAKVLWYLLLVCYTLLATAFQYSVVALALVAVVVFLA
eukprot:TRINITY_DN13873_c2_g1_i2.p1 TRINITY_DN13873_c2_g1~~TRINITY_DN13873_c2_g1_i2.p1  ORF type:complete len:144 (+),score=16.33 TRINITY_DN13873_c2_g1_i2:137-568(+)